MLLSVRELLMRQHTQLGKATPPARQPRRLLGMPGLELDIIFDPDFWDQVELRLDEINVLLFRLQDLAEQVAGDKIAHAFAVDNPLAQDRQRILLEPEIAFENLLHSFADQQLVEIL